MKTKSVLVLNSGSSSLKFGLFEEESGAAIMSGSVTNIIDSAKLTVKLGSTVIEEEIGKSSHADAVRRIMGFASKDMKYVLSGVGHRVVHGGKIFLSPTVINDDVLSKLKDLIVLAPLHQPYNIEGIKAISFYDPDLRQVACFDTSFHVTQPSIVKQFAIPKKYTEDGVLRYGFHGLSYQYISSVMPIYFGKNANGRVIVLHLGNGSSICAMNDLKSVATTMGFTALDGLMMGTRCGSIDPGAIIYLLQNYNMSISDLVDILYNKSGLKGVSGISHDMVKLLDSTSDSAKEAIELFCYNAAKHLSSLIPAINGLDSIVFTGGIGSNSSVIRRKICSKLSWLGVLLDEEKNKENSSSISSKDSGIGVYVIQTDEEKIIFNETKKLL
jgi:acetate kinase